MSPRPSTKPRPRTPAFVALGVFVAVLVVAAWSWLGAGGAPRPAHRGSAAEQAAAVRPEADRALAAPPDTHAQLAPLGRSSAKGVPGSGGGGEADQQVGPRSEANRRAPPDEERDEERERPVTWVVGGALTAWTGGALDWRATQIHVTRPATSESATTNGRPDGLFHVDVTAFAPRAAEEDALLVVRVDHPAFLVEHHELDAARAFTLPNESGQREAFLPFRLDPPVAFVQGEVEASKSVEVALFELGARGALALVDQDRVEPGPFSLRVPGQGHYWLAATSEGHEPATREVASVQRGEVRVDRIALGPGMTIRGQVLLPGREPARGFVVHARPDDMEYEAVGFAGLGFNGERFARLEQRADADDEGRFELNGLSEVRHAVSVEVPPELEPPIPPRPDSVEPPPPELVLFAPLVAVEFLVVGEGGPLRSARVQAQWGEGRTRQASTDESGTTTLVLPADQGGWALVRAAGHAPKAVRLETPAPGVKTVRHVRLEPTGEGDAELVLVPGDRAPERVRVALRLPGVPAVDHRLVARDEEGHYRIGALHAGAVEIEVSEVEPGSYGSPWSGRVTLVADRRVQQRFRLALGGRLRLEVRGAGRLLVRAELIGPTHERIPFVLAPCDTAGIPTRALAEPRPTPAEYLAPGVAYETFPNLPPGGYELVLKSRGWSRAVPFEAVEGRSELRMLDLPEAPAKRRRR